MRTPTIAALTLTAALSLAACTSSGSSTPADSSKLDQSASFACDDFAHGFKAAQTRQARTDLANKVNKWAQESSTNRIPDMAAALARGSDGSSQAWKIGADAFAQACLDAGWKA